MYEISLRQKEGILPKWYNLWYTFPTNQTKGFRRSMPVIFCGTTADMTPLTTRKKENWCMDSGAFFRSEKCRHRVKPAIFCRGRFQFLDENSACFSHRQSGGLRYGFAFLELLCTKIRDKRKPLGCAADPEAFARAKGSSWRQKILVTRVQQDALRMISMHTSQEHSLDENRFCFRSGGQTGCGSELVCVTRFAVLLLLFSTPYPFVGFLNDRRLGK